MRPDLQIITRPQEIERLADFACEVWHEHYDTLLGRPQVDYMVEKFQSVPALTQQLKNGYEYYAVIDRGSGTMMGYCAVRPEEQERRLFLSKLYVGARYRKRGLATMVLEFLKQYAHTMNADRIYLTVNKHNDGSIAAYRRFGFRTVREETTDIGCGYVMDDYIMEKELDGGIE